MSLEMYPVLSDDILITYPDYITLFQDFLQSSPSQDNIQKYVRELHDIYCIESKCYHHVFGLVVMVES